MSNNPDQDQEVEIAVKNRGEFSITLIFTEQGLQVSALVTVLKSTQAILRGIERNMTGKRAKINWVIASIEMPAESDKITVTIAAKD